MHIFLTTRAHNHRLQSAALNSPGNLTLPFVRTCFERSQRLSGVAVGSVLIVNTCSPAVAALSGSANTGRVWNIWAEFVQGPTAPLTSSSAMAQAAITATDAQLLKPNFFIVKAEIVVNPYDVPETIPFDAGWRLGVSDRVLVFVFFSVCVWLRANAR